MNRNLYQYKPYDNPNQYTHKQYNNRNNNFFQNNYKTGKFQSSPFLHTKKNRKSYQHQGNVNRNNNNKTNDNYLTMSREREKKQNDEEMHVHEERCWKRKRNNSWKEIQKISKQNVPVDQTKEVPATTPPKWCKEDAVKAIEIEHAFNYLQSNQYVLRFPDPFIDKSIIKGYSSAIVDVRVQQPITPRFVYIQLQPESDPEKLRHELSKIQFGNGFLKLEKRNVLPTSEHLKPEDVDPYTIFLGNIHSSTSVQSVKESVSKAYRVDVGFAKKHKFGRYAFAKFRTAVEARHAFTTLRQSSSSNGGMDMVVRFRRLRGNIMTNGNNRREPGKSASESKAVLENNDETSKMNGDEKNAANESKTSSDPTAVDLSTSNLLTNDIPDWNKSPMLNIGPSSNNSSLTFTSLDNTCMESDLDDLINQLYADVSSVFTDDFDLC